MLILLLSLSVTLASLGTEAVVGGTVLDAESGRPLAGATVTVDDATPPASTGLDGRYEIAGVAAGSHSLEIRALGHAPYALHVLVPRSGRLEVNVMLQPLTVRLPVVEVRRAAPTGARAVIDIDDAGTRLQRAIDLARQPLLAEPDFLRAAAGGDVVVAAETPGGLHVRGGSSDQTAYSIDGVPVFNPYHASDLMGGWNTDAFQGAALSAAPPGVAALAGSLQLTTRTPGAQIVARGGASTSHGRLTVDGPLGIGSAGFLLSGRTAWPAFLAPENDATFVRGESADWLAKIESGWKGGTLRLLMTRSNDLVRLSPTVEGAAVPAAPAVNGRDTFSWSSESAALQWQRSVGDDSLHISGWRSATAAGGAWGISPLVLDSRRAEFGLQAQVSHRSAGGVADLGIRFESSRMAYRVHDATATSLDATDVRSDTPMLTTFGALERRVAPTLRLGATASAVQFGHRSYLSPRLSGRWEVTPRLALAGSLGRRHQFAQSLQNTESVVSFVFPADLMMGAGNGVIPVAASDEGSLSLDYEPVAGVRARVHGFSREMRGLALVAPVENSPFLNGPVATGSATARGLSAETELRGERFLLLVRYARQRVRYVTGTVHYAPTFAPGEMLDGGVSLFPSPTLSLRVGAAAAVDRHVTPASGPFEWESCNLRDRGCEFAGSPRAESALVGVYRLPHYVRIDLGVRKTARLRMGARSAEVALFGTYANVLNRFNVLTYALLEGSVRGVEMRPQAPFVIGLDWRF